MALPVIIIILVIVTIFLFSSKNNKKTHNSNLNLDSKYQNKDFEDFINVLEKITDDKEE